VRVEPVVTVHVQPPVPPVPQLMSPPLTVPFVGAVTVSVLVPAGVAGVNSAVSSRLPPLSGTEQLLEVPVQSLPLQPENVQPAVAEAVIVTLVPDT
jgi:hypothetical protein